MRHGGGLVLLVLPVLPVLLVLVLVLVLAVRCSCRVRAVFLRCELRTRTLTPPAERARLAALHGAWLAGAHQTLGTIKLAFKHQEREI